MWTAVTLNSAVSNQLYVSAHKTWTVLQQDQVSFIPRAAVRVPICSGTNLDSSRFLAEAEKTVHDRNGRTVMVHFCWLCYPPTEVLINANCKRGQLYTPWCMIRTTVLATNESKQQLSSLLLKLEPTHKHSPKKQTKKTPYWCWIKGIIRETLCFSKEWPEYFWKIDYSWKP